MACWVLYVLQTTLFHINCCHIFSLLSCFEQNLIRNFIPINIFKTRWYKVIIYFLILRNFWFILNPDENSCKFSSNLTLFKFSQIFSSLFTAFTPKSGTKTFRSRTSLLKCPFERRKDSFASLSPSPFIQVIGI